MLQVRDLQVSYGRIRAVHDVSLELPRGEIVAVVGANGAGKSTILRAIAGLNRVDHGEILLDGEAIHRLPAHRRVGRGMALVPEGRHIFARQTVHRNLELGAYTRRDRAEVAASIELVYRTFPVLAERRDQRAGTLSGGEQQMLAIGRGLMSRPRLLLLDEPSLGLAPLFVKGIFKIISDIRTTGTTVVLVEQNVHMALNTADYAYLIQTGRVILSDSSSALRERE